MRSCAFVLAVAALLAGTSSVPGATTNALDPLAAAALSRRAATSSDTPVGRRTIRRLDALSATIGAESASLGDDLLAARRVARALRRWFHRDSEFAPLFDAAVESLATSAQEERVRFAAWAGRLDDAAREKTLLATLRATAGLYDRAGRARGAVDRLWFLRGGCARIERARAAMNLVGDPPGPPTGTPIADFSLPDVNPNSATFGRDVSPRDFLGRTSAWYFGHAT